MGYAIEVREILKDCQTRKMINDLEDEIGLPSGEDFYTIDSVEMTPEQGMQNKELFF